MSLWKFRIGRLALSGPEHAKPGVAIGGWRRLFWRFWWRTTAKVLPPLVRAAVPGIEVVPGVRAPKAIIHWSPRGDGYILCEQQRPGENTHWAAVFDESVTCPQCQADGGPINLHYWANTR